MRSAMGMLELIISIVVMGIVVTSLPLILTQTHNSNAYAIQQEAILAAKTKVGEILTYEWDDNSYDAILGRTFVLDVTSNPELQRVINTTRRKGHVNLIGRRRFANSSSTPTNFGNDATANDIDDFHNDSSNLILHENAGNLDYVFDLNITTKVSYEDDGISGTHIFDPDSSPTGNTNIKMIEVTAKTPTNDLKPIILRAFACNIGDSLALPSEPYQ